MWFLVGAGSDRQRIPIVDIIDDPVLILFFLEYFILNSGADVICDSVHMRQENSAPFLGESILPFFMTFGGKGGPRLEGLCEVNLMAIYNSSRDGLALPLEARSGRQL